MAERVEGVLKKYLQSKIQSSISAYKDLIESFDYQALSSSHTHKRHGIVQPCFEGSYKVKRR